MKTEQTPLEQLTAMTEQVGKERRRSAKPRNPVQKVERFYRVQLESIVRAIRKEIEQDVVPAVKGEKESYLQDAAYTADGWADRIIAAIRRVARRYTEGEMGAAYERLAKRTVSMAEAESTDAFLKSVNEAAGVDMSRMMDQEGINEYVEAAQYQNAQLIKSVSQDYLSRVESAVIGGIRDGDAPTTITSRIREATGVSRRQAQKIARDQTAKLTSEITERRQRSAGIRYYKSITAGDERVTGKPGGKYPNAKISCWGIANQDVGYGPGVYRWDVGAEWGGQKGLHAGRHHINCRCSAKPVFSWEVEGNND